MYKSPKYKSIQINSVKDRQKYFKNLYDEVNKSRMAVQTITSFKNTQMSFKRKIDQIQQQLHNSMTRINLQTKKNVILNQLITLMKGQMFNFQKTLKREEEKTESQTEKKIKKIQYDIEQILQKHNEEIAKITSLKELANSGRSQRVVFSNLFKKLEKEIKQNEESYKENLTRSEIAKDRTKGGRSVSRVVQSNQIQLANSRHSQTNIDIFQVDSKFLLHGPSEQPAFITLQRQRSFEGQLKRSQKRSQNPKQVSNSQLYDMKSSSRGFSQMISCYQTFIQKMKVYTQFTSIHQAIKHYESLQHANQHLSSQIQVYSQEVGNYEKMIHEINVQKRQSQCYENGDGLPMGSCRRIRLQTEMWQGDEDNTRRMEEAREVILQVSDLLGVRGDGLEANEEMLKELDSRLDLILQDSKLTEELMNQEVIHANRATTATTEGNPVDILLDKMDRFSQCQKILDKNLFKQEYLKQLSKTKKHKTRK